MTTTLDEYDSHLLSLTEAGDQVKIEQEAQDKDLEIFMIDLEMCMGDKASRHVIRKILEWSGFTTAPTLNNDRIQHAEGKRSLGFEIKEALDQLDRRHYPQLLLEGVEYEEALYKS